MHRLTSLFPTKFLEVDVKELDVVERDCKFQVPVIFWAFGFGFAAGES